MEDLIKAFMRIDMPTPGAGYGYGAGDGSGDGYGYGDGSGDGYGYGYGYGDGYGYGYGAGDGAGYGDGDGDGSGDGDGYGYGYGDGSKLPKTAIVIKPEDYRKGFLETQIASFKSFNGKPVYYIDNIPCYFLSVVNNLAKVEVIQDDMSTKKMYIAKSGNLFAHGETKELALRDVQSKFFASMSFEAKKSEFIKLFKKEGIYPAKHFFEWHHHLTGSCESGRMMFVKSHGIDLDGGMSTITFLNLTANEYNGQVIREILASL